MERVKHLKVGQLNRTRSQSIDMIVMGEVSKIIGNDNINNNNNNNNNTNNFNINNSNNNSSNNLQALDGHSSINSQSSLSSRDTLFLSTPSLQQQLSPPLSPRGTTLSFVSTPNLSNTTPPTSPKPDHHSHHHHHSHSNNNSQGQQTTVQHSTSGGHHISISILDKVGGLSRNSSFGSVSDIPGTPTSSNTPPPPFGTPVPLPPPASISQSEQGHQIQIHQHQSILRNSQRMGSYRNSVGFPNGADQPFPPSSPSRASLTLPPVLDQGARTNGSSDSLEGNNNNNSSKKKKKSKRLLKRVRKVLQPIIESWWWVAAMITTILFIIFVDDIIGLCGSPSSTSIDVSIITVKIAIFIFFIADIILCIILYWSRYYPGTIVFWLDLVSALSILPDIVVYFLDDSLSRNMLALTIGRSARIIRICGSLVRISLISTIYNRFLRKKNRSDDSLEVEASKLGDKLIRLSTNKIVLLVLLVYFASQLLTYLPPRDDYVRTTLQSFEFQATMFGSNSTEFIATYQNFLQSSPTITRMIIGKHILFADQARMASLQRGAVQSYHWNTSSISYDDSQVVKMESAYHLSLTCFVIILLIIINLLIVNDAHWLVINPLENVLAIVKLLSRQNASIQQKQQQQQQLQPGQQQGIATTPHSFRKDRLESVGSKSEDTTSSSGVEDGDADESDEANYLIGMLSDIDGSLQAAKEKVEEESYQNAKLRNHIEDLYLEKFVLNIHLKSIQRKIEIDDIIGMMLKKKQLLLSANVRGLPDGINCDDIKFRQDDAISALSHSQFAQVQPNPHHQFTVLSASLDKLIERLTRIENHDIKFANVFLLTFRRFLTPIELMERLIIRFCVTPQFDLPANLLPIGETVEDWRRTKQDQIRVSVFNVIKLWIGKYYWDFQGNNELVELFNTLVQQIMVTCRMERYALHLDTLFKRKLASYMPLADYIPVKPLTPEETAELMVIEDRLLYSFEIVDIATQITLIEFELFKSIRPQELIDLAWTKSKTKTKTSPNVVRFIDHFNNVSFWIQMQIVRCGKVKDRVVAIKRIIALGDAFVNLNNYYGAMIVLSSLESAAVSRLHRTWDQVPVSSKESFQALQKLLSPKGSFKEYRERLKQTTSACIPYLGIYLSDLTFIEEGNPDYRDELINFTKLREIAATILSIQQFQNTLFYYQEVKEKIKSQLDMKWKIIDNETIWKMSLTCEPKRQ